MSNALLEKLRSLNEEAARQFPTKFDPGFGGVGLILHKDLQNGGYSSTPVNSLAFAGTGGGGVHFSFVTFDSPVDDNSPVIVTIPGAFGSENLVVGENLYDFLCLGMHRGYFALEQLGYKFEETAEVYSNPTWGPTTKHHKWVGYGVDDHQRALLDFLTHEFELVPWKNVEAKLATLAEKYKKLLTMPDEYSW